MRQSIETKRETMSLEATGTAICPGRCRVSGGGNAFCARRYSVSSLSEETKVMPDTYRTRRLSLSRTEEFFAEGPMACSAVAVLAVSPKSRSPKAVATAIATMSEQRCCAEA